MLRPSDPTLRPEPEAGACYSELDRVLGSSTLSRKRERQRPVRVCIEELDRVLGSSTHALLDLRIPVFVSASRNLTECSARALESECSECTHTHTHTHTDATQRAGLD